MDAGYLGVGNMGQPMARKLLDAGHTLTIYDLSEAAMRPLLERQARRAASISLTNGTPTVQVLTKTFIAPPRMSPFGPSAASRNAASVA